MEAVNRLILKVLQDWLAVWIAIFVANQVFGLEVFQFLHFMHEDAERGADEDLDSVVNHVVVDGVQ